jgi:tetratricopeptide (TPR) repeat protein
MPTIPRGGRRGKMTTVTPEECLMIRVAATVALLFLAASPAAAQFDPEVRALQRWNVVLKVQPHPLLAASFREQLRHDLVAALQPVLGSLGTVEVVDLADPKLSRDKWDALWLQFEDKGFAALDVPRDLSGLKTHFLKVEYRDGQYHLESRQYDGFAGLASPVVRRQSVRSPEMVGRTAGLMLERDFGLTGSIEVATGKVVEEVKVTVRGGQLGSLDRLVKVNDVFTMSQVVKTNRVGPAPDRTATGKIETPAPGTAGPPALTANPRAFTLLRVKAVEKDGTLRCAVLSRYENPATAGRNVLGYRCMKLGTVEAPLTVKLVSEHPESQKNAGAVIVRATERGFDAKPDARDTLQFQDKEGVFRSARELKHVACVTVSLGPTVTKTFPVPILGPEPVSLPFEMNPKLEAQAEHMRSLLAASVRVADARNAQTICFEATAKLLSEKKADANARAFARARGGFQAAAAAHTGLTDELARLKEFSDTTPAAGKLIATIESNLAALQQVNTELEKHVKLLEAVVARENNPALALADGVQAQIGLLLGRGDVDEAINAYDQLVTLLDTADQKSARDEAKAARDKLKAEWAPKDEVHKKAREYLLETWRKLGTIPEYHGSLKQIEAEVQVCIDRKDKLALRKLLTIFAAAAVRMNELVERLDPTADAAQLKAAKEAGEKLAALEIKITEFVNKKE